MHSSPLAGRWLRVGCGGELCGSGGSGGAEGGRRAIGVIVLATASSGASESELHSPFAERWFSV